MKLNSTLLGIVLIIVGVFAFAYQGFTYTKQEKIAEVGDIKLTANVQKSVYLPPIIGGVSIAAGVVLVIIGSL
jgi:uncharacterized membrane protein YidH (DUF202 family)